MTKPICETQIAAFKRMPTTSSPRDANTLYPNDDQGQKR
jgi:hypothetical protein